MNNNREEWKRLLERVAQEGWVKRGDAAADSPDPYREANDVVDQMKRALANGEIPPPSEIRPTEDFVLD